MAVNNGTVIIDSVGVATGYDTLASVGLPASGLKVTVDGHWLNGVWYPYAQPQYYPWPYSPSYTYLQSDKPHEAIDKATQQIASAARDLLESADKLGVPIDKDALREAIIARITEALG